METSVFDNVSNSYSQFGIVLSASTGTANGATKTSEQKFKRETKHDVGQRSQPFPFVTIYIPIGYAGSHVHSNNKRPLGRADFNRTSGMNVITSLGSNNLNITPFLPSNQIPGPFRPIPQDKNQLRDLNALEETDEVNAIGANPNIQKGYISKPMQYTPDTNFKEEYIQLLPTLDSVTEIEQPTTIKHQLFPIIGIDEKIKDFTTSKPTRKSTFGTGLQFNENRYELDPDDGYIKKVIPVINRSPINRTNQPNKSTYYGTKHTYEDDYYFREYTDRTNTQQFSANLYKPNYDSVVEHTTPTAGSDILQDNRQHLTEITEIKRPSKSHYPETLMKHNLTYDTLIDDYTRADTSFIDIPEVNEEEDSAIKYTQNIIGEKRIAPTNGHTSNTNHTSKINLGSTFLTELLHKLHSTAQKKVQLSSNTENVDVDYSIVSLFKILNDLKRSKETVGSAPVQQPHVPTDPKKTLHFEALQNEYMKELKDNIPGPDTGRPGIDYPVFDEIPKTDFNCKNQRYKGFFGDPETHCQVWHYCDLNGGHASFLCPNGTIFSQVLLTCDWWFNVKCSSTTQLYVLNERLYKYILPFSPKFPEDYTGPLVDKYLSIKFQEMEEKMRREKNKNRVKSSEETETQAPPLPTSPAQATTDDPNMPLIDEDGQSHNVDSAQQGNFTDTPDAYKNYVVPVPDSAISINTEYAEDTTSMIDDPGDQTTQSASEPSDTFRIEIKNIKGIEIKSDGSSGHLSPLQLHDIAQ